MKIRNLSELEEEKRKKKMEIEVTKRAFIHSFGTTQTQAKDVFLNKLMVPTSIAGIATLGVKKLVKTSKSSSNKEGHSLLKLLPVALPILQSFFSSPERLALLPPFLQQFVKTDKKKSQL